MKSFFINPFVVSAALAILSTVAAAADCLVDPSDVDCAHFVYGDASINADLTALCHADSGSMPYMTGCSVWDACLSNKVYDHAGGRAMTLPSECNLWDLLRTICVHDSMSGMGGCKNHKALCTTHAATTLVPGCQDPFMTFLPTSRDVADNIMDMCSGHHMTNCDDCTFGGMMNFPTNKCDMLVSFSGMCLAMPSMSGCEHHATMCSHADSHSMKILQGYCSSGAGSEGAAVRTKTPVMNMFFTTERNFYLLFKDWVPQTDSEYIGAWFAIFFMGIVVEGISLLKAWTEVVFVASRVARRKLKEESTSRVSPSTFVSETACKPGVETNGEEMKTIVPATTRCAARQQQREVLVDSRLTSRLGQAIASTSGLWLAFDLLRVIISLVSTFGGYLLMLASMCFNVGIFAAVVVGLAIGSVGWSYLRPVHYGEGVSSPMDEDKVCHCG